MSANTAPIAGLVMTGGGARAAYQVGVLRAIADLLPSHAPNPFPVICGASAGALNCAALATYAHNFRAAVRRIHRVWSGFHTHHVFRSDAPHLMKSGAHWLAALMMGGIGRNNPSSLLDRSPLRDLVSVYLPAGRVQKAIDAGHLRALAVTASAYTTGESVTFFQGQEGIEPWRRARRVGRPATISLDHLMASSAIPFVFESIDLGDDYYGDGSMRLVAPLSPALHLGATRVLVIGVRHDNGATPATRASTPPSMAHVAGHVLNSIFLDSLEGDLERMHRINQTVARIPSHTLRESGVDLRHVDVLAISPSCEIEVIAAKHAASLPRAFRYLLRSLGVRNGGGANLLSYLLFEQAYCQELITLGYDDAMRRRAEIGAFLGLGGGFEDTAGHALRGVRA